MIAGEIACKDPGDGEGSWMNGRSAFRKIIIIGHKAPDTDSVCSALAYSWLKNGGSLSGKYEAMVAGKVNRETAFALDYFGVESPGICTDISPQLKDVDIRMRPGIAEDMSIYDAMAIMKGEDIATLVITDDKNLLRGLITLGDVAKVNTEIMNNSILEDAETPYENIIKVLDARLLAGDKDAKVKPGKVCVATSPQFMKEFITSGDFVIGTNVPETQDYAIDLGASAIVVCFDTTVPDEIMKKARERGCDVFVTPYDTYNAARLINTAIPVGFVMCRGDTMQKFSVNTPIEDAVNLMSKVRFRYFPVLDEKGKYKGVVSRRNFLNLHKKQVILVDHNEKLQAVDGLEDAEILEVIDHHRIGDLETPGPVYFRNEAVGCTATIIFHMCKERGMLPDKSIAGLLLSAIVSDTLLFRSPTSTAVDEKEARELAGIAGVDIESYAEKMFEAGASLMGRSAEDVFKSDFKIFSSGDIKFGVGQAIYMTEKSKKDAENLLGPYLEEARVKEGLPMVFFMFTDMKNQSTDLMYSGKDALYAVQEAFGVGDFNNDTAVLKAVVSRKKQLIPPLIQALLKQK